jgi:hypothetical protein
MVVVVVVSGFGPLELVVGPRRRQRGKDVHILVKPNLVRVGEERRRLKGCKP